jgi:hypothetical protein
MRLFTLAICLLALVSIIGCNSDEPGMIEEPSFEIESDELFTVLEKYENGWIKSAVKTTLSGATEYEVTYHENGYLSTYKVYSINSGHVEFEHSRNELNLPLSSSYYDVDGELFATLEYSSGELVTKELFNSDNTNTITNYKSGRVFTQEKLDSEGSSIANVEYDYSNDLKTLTTKSADGGFILMTSSIDDFIATGFNYNDDFQLLNVTEGNYELWFQSIESVSTSSINQQKSIDPLVSVGVSSLVYAENDQDFVESFGSTNEVLTIKGTLNDGLFRSIREQYPFTEQDVVFVGKSNFIEGEYFGLTTYVFEDFLEEKKEEFGEDFNAVFGTHFVNSYFTGLFVYYIGTLRNLPSDQDLRDEIIDIAERHIDWITTGTDPVSDDELDLLSNVFFEFKVHSNSAIDENGLILNNHDEYETAIRQLEIAEMQIVQTQLVNF